MATHLHIDSEWTPAQVDVLNPDFQKLMGISPWDCWTAWNSAWATASPSTADHDVEGNATVKKRLEGRKTEGSTTKTISAWHRRQHTATRQTSFKKHGHALLMQSRAYHPTQNVFEQKKTISLSISSNPDVTLFFNLVKNPTLFCY